MTTKFDVVEWMATNGHPSYKNEIAAIRGQIEIAMTDEDREHGMRMIDMFDEEIERITREAQDRYDDWVSDIYD